MTIEFRTESNKIYVIDQGIRLAHIDIYHNRLPTLTQYAPFTIDILQQIILKMKEEQGEVTK